MGAPPPAFAWLEHRQRARMGNGALGIALRTVAFIRCADGFLCRLRSSTIDRRPSPTRLVAFDRHRVRRRVNRTALAAVSSGARAIFQELVGDRRRAEVCWPNEPHLAALVWLAASRQPVPDCFRGQAPRDS